MSEHTEIVAQIITVLLAAWSCYLVGVVAKLREEVGSLRAMLTRSAEDYDNLMKAKLIEVRGDSNVRKGEMWIMGPGE